MICAQPQARGVNCDYETVVHDYHFRGDILVAGTRLCACVRYWPSLGVGTCAKVLKIGIVCQDINIS